MPKKISSEGNISSVMLAESAAPGTPASGFFQVYAKTDGKLYCKNDAGTEVCLSDTVATDPIWDAAGDLAVGSGANTAAKLASGAVGTVLTGNGVGSAPSWQAAAGGDIGEGHITILPFSYSAIGAGTWGAYDSENVYLDWFFYNTSTNNLDNISYKVYLAAGTYTLFYFHLTNNDNGIVDIDIDGTEVGSVDCYSNPAVVNVRTIITGIVIAASGLKELKFRVDGKNGSSSDYVCTISYIALWRTA